MLDEMKNNVNKVERENFFNASIQESDRNRRDNEIFDIYRRLLRSEKDGEILRGRVTGTEKLEEKVFIIVLFEKEIKVYVPFNEFFRDDIIRTNIDISTEKGMRNYLYRKNAIVKQTMGLIVPFLVTECNPQENLVIASRKAALEIFERVNFEPDENGETRIKEGQFVNALVVSTGAQSIVLNVGGIDTVIEAHQLTYRYLKPFDLEQIYLVNEPVRTYIKTIKKDENGNFHLSINCKFVELAEGRNKQERYFPLLVNRDNETKIPREKYWYDASAIISQITYSEIKDNERIARLWLEEYDMPATAFNIPPVKYGPPLNVGDRVRVRIFWCRNDGMTIVKINERVQNYYL